MQSNELNLNKMERLFKELSEKDEKLKRQKQRFEGIVRVIPDVVLILDRWMEIVWHNNVAVEYFGEDLTGRKCYDVLVDGENICDGCVIRKVFADMETRKYTKEVILKDGEKKTLWWFVSVSEMNGDATTVILVGRDVDVLQVDCSKEVIE
jgi:PAS domain-containing protein